MSDARVWGLGVHGGDEAAALGTAGSGGRSVEESGTVACGEHLASSIPEQGCNSEAQYTGVE